MSAEKEKTGAGAHGLFPLSDPVGTPSLVNQQQLGPPIWVPLQMGLECQGL